MDKILITGGAGFIGSTLANRLLKEGAAVTVLDDLSTGKKENLLDSPRLTFHHGSVTDTALLHQLLETGQFDYIYHLAAIASVARSIEKPQETHAVNYLSAVELVTYLQRAGLPLKKFLFASSAAVYGSAPGLPKHERAAIEPDSPYGIDKFAAERYVLSFGRQNGLPTVATRFFNVYGPKQNPDSPYSGVLSILTDCLLHDKPFTLFGTGEQTRDFVYVEDVVDALLHLAQGAAVHEVFNVGTGRQTSLLEVIEHLETAFERELSYQIKPQRTADIKDSAACTQKLNAQGIYPKYDIVTGIRNYAAGLKDPERPFAGSTF